MKNTGIVRHVDELGRIVLPKELRKTLDIKEKDPVEVWTEGNTVVLKKFSDTDKCKHCGATENVVKVDGIIICGKCAYKLLDIFKKAR